jgi:two-component system chemotaxis response regulator CheB
MGQRATRLLAVDDDAASAELIVRVAERCGYEAFATSDSRGVTNLVDVLKPDVMAVDISMPHIDALQLFKLLANKGYRGEIMIVSGQDVAVLEQARQTAIEAGLATPTVHQKPLNFQLLREALARPAIRRAG